jgi:hypothetical protein
MPEYGKEIMLILRWAREGHLDADEAQGRQIIVLLSGSR